MTISCTVLIYSSNPQAYTMVSIFFILICVLLSSTKPWIMTYRGAPVLSTWNSFHGCIIAYVYCNYNSPVCNQNNRVCVCLQGNVSFVYKLFQDTKMAHLADLFSLPEMCLLSQVAQYFLDNDLPYHSVPLFNDVKVRWCQCHLLPGTACGWCQAAVCSWQPLVSCLCTTVRLIMSYTLSSSISALLLTFFQLPLRVKKI